MATPDPSPTEQGQGSNTHPHGYWSGPQPAEPRWEFPGFLLLSCKSSLHFIESGPLLEICITNILLLICSLPFQLLKCCFFVCLFVFRATPQANGGSQSRDRIRAVATALCHSHSNARSEPCLQPAPTYTTAHGNARSLTHWVRRGAEPASSSILVRFLSPEPRRELL